MPQTYRERLRREGAVLAVTGAAGSAALLATAPEARRWPWNTVGQLAGVAALLATVGVLAALVPARRAAGVDPVITLRND